jgi:hypothetical protein
MKKTIKKFFKRCESAKRFVYADNRLHLIPYNGLVIARRMYRNDEIEGNSWEDFRDCLASIDCLETVFLKGKSPLGKVN